MQGWTGIVPPHFDAGRVDDVWPIEDADALEMTRRLGARRLAEQLGPDAVVVTLAVDSGFKYMTGPPYA
jgi:cysteine synthase